MSSMRYAMELEQEVTWFSKYSTFCFWFGICLGVIIGFMAALIFMVNLSA